MLRIDAPGLYVLYDGELAKVISIGEGRCITIEQVGAVACPTCGAKPRVSAMESSSLIQGHVQPVPTIRRADG